MLTLLYALNGWLIRKDAQLAGRLRLFKHEMVKSIWAGTACKRCRGLVRTGRYDEKKARTFAGLFGLLIDVGISRGSIELVEQIGHGCHEARKVDARGQNAKGMWCQRGVW